MPKVRTLVPLEDEEGPIAVGDVIDVSDEQAAEWRAAGKVSLIEDEERNAAQAGVYDAVTGREDVAAPQPTGQDSGGPQEDDPPPKKGKK